MEAHVLIQALANGVLRSGLYALTAVGLALSVGVLHLINFAHGEFLMLGAYLGVFAFGGLGLDPFLAVPIGGAIMFALGAILYRGPVKRVMRSRHLNQMLLTFGLSIFIQNLAIILWKADPRGISPSYRAAVVGIGPVHVGFTRAVTFAVATTLVVVLYLLLARTSFGRAVRAAAQNAAGAYLSGIEVERVYLYAFAISAALAGMAGVMLSVTLYAHPLVGLEFTLKAFCIVIVAGMGNVNGVLWASLFLGLAESLVGTYVPQGSGWAEGVFFALMLAVLLARPQGLARGSRA